jgi:glycosyltransferase involved in cell wall biosynthesis
MYPSKLHVRYGIFVQNFEKAVKTHYNIERVVLTKKDSILTKLLGYVFLYMKIFSLILKAKREDILYVHFPLQIAPALWFINFFKKRIILNFHGSDLIFKSPLTKFLSLFLKPLMNKNYIVVPSNYYKNKIAKEYNINSHQIFVYPSGGINTNVFYPMPTPKNKSFVLGFVSNFIKSKGWEIFLIAVDRIIKKRSIDNIEVVLIGDGPDKKKIDQFLSKSEINYRMVSSVLQSELSVKYNEFDLFIFPTYREAESLGLVGLEAMACGTPVIAGKVGGPMGYIKSGSNSFLFQKKDSDDLVEKILEYYFLSERDKELIKYNAIETAKQYETKKVNAQLLSFLKSLN